MVEQQLCQTQVFLRYDEDLRHINETVRDALRVMTIRVA
jgi:hypothetical protein